MSDENFNEAHIPDSSDPAPPNTHGVETPHTSTVERELAAGTSTVSGLPGAMNIVHPPVGQMSNPILEENPSGSKVRSFSPTGVHDVNSRGE